MGCDEQDGRTQLATCEVLVLHGSMQLGELGPLQLTAAAGATAEQYSQVTTLTGSNASDIAQIVSRRAGALVPAEGRQAAVWSPDDLMSTSKLSWGT